MAAASAFGGGATALDRLAAGALDLGPAVTPDAPSPLAPASRDASWPSSTWSTPTRTHGHVAGAGGLPASPADIAAVWGVRSTTPVAAGGAGTLLTPGRPASTTLPLWTAGNGSGGGGSGQPHPTAPHPAQHTTAAPPSTFYWSIQRAALAPASDAAAVVAAAPEEDAPRSLPSLSPAPASSPGAWQGANQSATAAAVLDGDSNNGVSSPSAGGAAGGDTDDASTLPPPRLIILVGLPGSGRSSAAAALADAGWAVVGVDDVGRRAAEVQVTGHLLAGRSVVLDGIHAKRSHRTPWVEAVKAAGAAVHALELRTPLEVCEARTRRCHPEMRPKEAVRLVRQWATVLEACREREGFESVATARSEGEVAAAVASFGRAARARARAAGPPLPLPDGRPRCRRRG